MYIDVLEKVLQPTEEIWTFIAFYCKCSKIHELFIKSENTIIDCSCKQPSLISFIGEELFWRPYTIREDRILFPEKYGLPPIRQQNI